MALLPFPCIYHRNYDFPLGDHVFPGRKYSGLATLLEARGWLDETNLLDPSLPTREQLLRVHTPNWVSALLDGTISYDEVLRLELPYSRRLVDICLLHVGGSILAAQAALREGRSFHIGGGFHHAFPAHGEGFCALHDVAIAIQLLLDEGCIESALVIDTDVHQGNGTAACFRNEPSVFTFSIHQENNYPARKESSSLDIGLADGVGDEDYLAFLASGLEQCFAWRKPGLVAYVAGSDPYRQDKLGGLNLSIEGMLERDRMVARAAAKHQVPVFVTLAGGYAIQLEDTITLHANTARALAECF